MARKQKKQDAVQFTRESSERIARVVRASETSMPRGSPLTFEPFFDTSRRRAAVRIGTYSTNGLPWEKGQAISVHLNRIQQSEDQNGDPVYEVIPQYDKGGMQILVTVLNLFVTIPPNYDSVRYVAFTSIDGVNVAITAEC